MRSYFGIHNHTMYSNIRLLDCINRPKELIDKAIELGMSGIAITDHECLSAHMEVNQYMKEIHEKHPEFKFALGNEIYLTDTRVPNQKYYHFILIAKNKNGYKALRELSTIAWSHVYTDRGMERVPTLKSELKEVMSKHKGEVIATSACIGGELSQNALNMVQAEEDNDIEKARIYYQNIIDFMNFCIEIFGEDFYVECAPGLSKEQVIVNRKLFKIAKAFNIKLVVGSDAHYLRPEHREIHKIYLNSKGGEREVDSFYKYAYLMSRDEIAENLDKAFGGANLEGYSADEILNNTLEIDKKIEEFSLERKQIIPKVEVKDYPRGLRRNLELIEDYAENLPVISSLIDSPEIQERYWISECLQALEEKQLINEIYLKRIEIEADIIKCIGDKLEDCLFAYFNTFKHYIDLFWECGSIVGPGRGSSTGFLSNYLLGITQLDPIRWNLPYWRFLNKERVELPDIDIDLAPSKRPKIFEAIRKERGPLGLVQVATFGTEGTKSAILSACRGYRGPNAGYDETVTNYDNTGETKEQHYNGIDVDIAQYMSSLVPQERGFLWSIQDVVYGNPEKDRKPVTAFINEVNKYPGLLDVIIAIDGLVKTRSTHASGVILYDDDPFETASFMKTGGGDLITCFDLHKAEAGGDTKYDFLVTEASDKIISCYELLLKDGAIPQLTLREFYNKYLHPEVLNVDDPVIWEHLAAGDILDVFQFSTNVGLAIAKRLKPQNMLEMTAANAMMRLMSEKDKESQQDRYFRIKEQGIDVFDREMIDCGMPKDMRDIMHKHCDKYYGCCPIQEQMMELLMEVASFTLAEANAARKIVAKKQMAKIPILKEDVFSRFEQESVANYFWENAIAPQLGYAFSLNHSLPYSFVGVQMIYFATQFNPIYWDTACLIVNSGSLEENTKEEIVDVYEPEGEDLSTGEVTFLDIEDGKKVKKTTVTDYGKIAKALGEIQSAGITIAPPDINKSGLTFRPDPKKDEIIYGIKGITRVGDDLIEEIINNRPYDSLEDFFNKVKINKLQAVNLIKSGAFDCFGDRIDIMKQYILSVSDQKKRLTLQNMAMLIKQHLIPESLEYQVRVFNFNKYLKKFKDGDNYIVDERAYNFYEKKYNCDNIFVIDNTMYISQSCWDKIYKKEMDPVRAYLKENNQELLNELNNRLFKETYDKYAAGSISKWEMDSICYYEHEHELSKINNSIYEFADFSKMPEEPIIERTFKTKDGKTIPIYKTFRFAGTVLGKDKAKGMVNILTTSDVATVRIFKAQFSEYDKQISCKMADGKKKVLEKSWFTRGNKIIVNGFRRGNELVLKKYKNTPYSVLCLITDIHEDGTLEYTDERVTI